MKYYAVIADIHGEIEQLDQTIARCNAFAEREGISLQFVFLGDLIDRGDSNNQVIERVKSMVEAGAILTLGNHDMFLIGCAEGDDKLTRIWGYNGGAETCINMFGRIADIKQRTSMYQIKEYGNTLHPWDYSDIIKNSWQYAFLKENGILYHETDNIFFCHAPQSDVKEPMTAWNLTWGRQTDYEHGVGDNIFKVPNNKRMSIHGHMHRLREGQNFTRIHNYVHGGIAKTVVLADSGCGCAHFGRLKAVILRERDKYPEIEAIL